MKSVKYEAAFQIAPSQGDLGAKERVVSVEVDDQGSESVNQANAIVTASLQLDEEGLTHWSLLRCHPAAS